MERIRELYYTYERYIFKYLYGLTLNYHVAEELTQETFLQIVLAFPKFRRDSHIATWIYSIARNVYRQWCRKKSVNIVPLNEETENTAEQEKIQDSMERQEQNKLIETVLRQLPARYREVLWLREWQELSYTEIAGITGHSMAWVKVNIHRARLAFKRAYQAKEEL